MTSVGASERDVPLPGVSYGSLVATFVLVAAYAGWITGWIIRDYIQWFTHSRELAQWFSNTERVVLQYGIGAALAGPLMRLGSTWSQWRQSRVTGAERSMRAQVSDYWWRVRWPAALLGWRLIIDLNRLVDMGLRQWPLVKMNWTSWRVIKPSLSVLARPAVEPALLAIAIFAINWQPLVVRPALWAWDWWTTRNESND